MLKGKKKKTYFKIYLIYPFILSNDNWSKSKKKPLRVYERLNEIIFSYEIIQDTLGVVVIRFFPFK